TDTPAGPQGSAQRSDARPGALQERAAIQPPTRRSLLNCPWTGHPKHAPELGPIAMAASEPHLGVALISARKNAGISRLKTKEGRFLRLPCAYGDEANLACVAIALI